MTNGLMVSLKRERGFILILKEFALDPNLIKDWDSCRLFLMPFDIYQGRQLSEFPDLRLWKDLIIKGLDKDRVGPKQRKKS